MNEYEIKDSGKRQEFGTGAVRDTSENKGRFDLLPMATLAAWAVHYERGSSKYGARNWEKGIPVSRFLDSAMRHLVKAMGGLHDENHLISALWNIACAYETLIRVRLGVLPKELKDMDIEVGDPWER